MTVLGRAVLGVVALRLIMLADGQGNTADADGKEPASVSLPSTDVCGKPSGRFNRIVGGSDVELGMFPWIAAVGYRNSVASNLTLFCTGSLVTEWHLVTTAWCVFEVKHDCKNQKKINATSCRIVARLGVLDLNHVEATGTEEDYELDTLLKHPDFLYTSEYDIGIMKLKKKVNFSRFIQPICLPVLNDFRTKNFTGSTAYIAGWDWTKYDGESATRMQQTQVRVWDLEKCKKVYEINKPVVHDSDVCFATDDGTQKCEGPLMMTYGPDCNYYLYGVTDYSYVCGNRRRPSVYARVSEYMDWILSNLK